jgi:hypothetical protein
VKGPARVLAQALLYVPLMAILAVFSRWPAFEHLGRDEALVRLSIAHAAERRFPCRKRTEEELAKLAPNMRAAEDCPRERVPLALELEVDGKLMYAAQVRPAGVQKDGLANLYHRTVLPAGEHRIVVRLRDRPLASDREFNHVRDERLTLAGGDSLVIDFSAQRGGLEFRR